MTTHSAQCPKCGTTIYTTVGGQAWLMCPSCAWYGLLVVAPTPAATGTAPASPALTMHVPCPHCNNSFTYTPGIPLAGVATRWYCSACGYHGPVVNPPPSAAPPPAPPYAPKASERTPDTMRDELREDVFALASDICEALRDVPAADWRLTVSGAYERMQEAHTALYEALGGRHMGDYPPDTFNVSRVVVAMATRLMLALYAAERASEEAKG